MTRMGDPVLDAAIECLGKRGWEPTTLTDVADAAGVPLDEVMRRYPSRDHLAAAAFDRLLDKLPAEFVDEVPADAPLQHRLYAAVAHVLRGLEPDKAFVRELFGQLARPWSTTFLTAAPLHGPTLVKFLGFVSEQVALARQRREIAAWVIPGMAASAFWLVHLSILGFWLNDASASSERTHATADLWITRYVRTLGGRIATPQRPSIL